MQKYIDLITSQYQNSPKFIEWTKRLLTPLIDVQKLALILYTYFDIDTAKGVQLDKLGEIIGAKRLLPFQPSEGNPLLNDEDYRFLLKAQILRNVWDGTNSNIYDIWNSLNPDIVIAIRDNQDMTVNTLFIGNISNLRKEMIEYGMIVPKAQGVKMFYAFSVPPLFSYDQDTDYFKGYDQSNWVVFDE